MGMETLTHLFANNQTLNKIPKEKQAHFMQAAIAKKYKKGQVLSFYGDLWPYLFVISRGCIQAVKESAAGRSLVVTTFSSGDIFWGLAFFYENIPMPVTLEACQDSEIYLWPRENVIDIIKQSGEFSWELTRLMITKMTIASEMLEEMTFQPVGSRLAKFLLESHGENQSAPISRSLTLDEMAARIGSTREMVCRFLHRFADEGMLEITRTEFRITNPDELKQISKQR
jgi:CRP/FNR family transcriptional regulator